VEVFDFFVLMWINTRFLLVYGFVIMYITFFFFPNTDHELWKLI